MTIEIKVINNIEEMVNKYCKKYGSSKVWVSAQIGLTKQGLYKLFQAEDFKYSTLIKLATVLDCHIDDLVGYNAFKKE